MSHSSLLRHNGAFHGLYLLQIFTALISDLLNINTVVWVASELWYTYTSLSICLRSQTTLGSKLVNMGSVPIKVPANVENIVFYQNLFIYLYIFMEC